LTWGNFGAASGAQPTSPQPTGVQPFAPGQVGQPPGQAGATLPATYNSGFESVMAAVSRGEVSLNQLAAANILGGVNNANNQAGNPTLLQAMSQGLGQNGTNGLGVRSGPAPAGEGTAAINIGSSNPLAGANTDPGSTLPIDPRQVLTSPGAALASPIQYGGA
jgi:hypothetical protein